MNTTPPETIPASGSDLKRRIVKARYIIGLDEDKSPVHTTRVYSDAQGATDTGKIMLKSGAYSTVIVAECVEIVELTPSV